MLAGGLTVVQPMAAHAATTEVISPTDVTTQPEDTPPTDQWARYRRNGGTAKFVNGPTPPPLGTATVQLSTPAATDKAQLFNFEHAGTALGAIGAIRYS